MKHFISLLFFTFSLSFHTNAIAQKVHIVGFEGIFQAGVSFVANEDLPAGTSFTIAIGAGNWVFNQGIYEPSTNVFSAGAYLITYTTTRTIGKGEVVVIRETGNSTNLFTTDCTAGTDCGTAVILAGSPRIDSQSAVITLYTDNDTDPTNGISDLYSVLHIAQSGGFGNTIDPVSDFPNASVVGGFRNIPPFGNTVTIAEFDVSKRDALNSFPNVADIEDVSANWVIPSSLSTAGILPTTTTNSIPTLSEWGLIILALMLMILGTLYLLQPSFKKEKQA